MKSLRRKVKPTAQKQKSRLMSFKQFCAKREKEEREQAAALGVITDPGTTTTDSTPRLMVARDTLISEPHGEPL